MVVVLLPRRFLRTTTTAHISLGYSSKQNVIALWPSQTYIRIDPFLCCDWLWAGINSTVLFVSGVLWPEGCRSRLQGRFSVEERTKNGCTSQIDQPIIKRVWCVSYIKWKWKTGKGLFILVSFTYIYNAALNILIIWSTIYNEIT